MYIFEVLCEKVSPHRRCEAADGGSRFLVDRRASWQPAVEPSTGFV